MLDGDTVGMVQDLLADANRHEVGGGEGATIAELPRQALAPPRAELAYGRHRRARLLHACPHERLVATDDADGLVRWNARTIVQNLDADLLIPKRFQREREIELLDQLNVTALPGRTSCAQKTVHRGRLVGEECLGDRSRARYTAPASQVGQRRMLEIAHRLVELPDPSQPLRHRLIRLHAQPHGRGHHQQTDHAPSVEGR